MMKRGFFALAALIGLGLIASCAVQQGPLSPSTTLLGQSNSSNTNMPVLGTPSNPSTTSSPLVIFFEHRTSGSRMAMDAATITNSTIQVYYKTSDTAESQLSGVTVAYNAALMQVSISHSGGWTDNTRYRVLITNSIRSAAGAAFDGNANGVAESSTFDNKNIAFSMGTPVESAYNLAVLTISSVNIIHAGGSTGITFGNANSIPLGTYRQVSITVTFSEPVDENSVFAGNSTLHNNFSFVVNSTGAAVAPIRVTMTASSQITGLFSVIADTTYKVSVRGGVNGVRTAVDASTDSPLRGRLFDGMDSDTVAGPNDSASRYFTTERLDTTSTAPPTVVSVAPSAMVTAEPTYYGDDNRYWEVEFTAPATGVMSQSSISSASNYTLQAAYNGNYYNVPIKAVEWMNDLTVRIHVPDSFYPNGDNVEMRIIVSRNVKDSIGNKLDGNSDGVGGLAEDDFQGYVFDVDSQP